MTLPEPEQHEGELKAPVGFWVKLVLFLGFFLQFVFAFLFFISIRYFEVFGASSDSASLKLTFELLISLMPAVPLGFLCSNFIFHHIPVVKDKLAEVSPYRETQWLLLKLLLITLLFVLFTGFIILLFIY